ncbi:hypothetical protein VM1G_07782 [Cytospora mali]|uniref:Uncharacterized protein n=1 Tax=Cytospora mali TaxID=578113 RepID=A0A194W833_CYTMA|nr:hypothetical protein VM1G_07782 [Valsa mali]
MLELALQRPFNPPQHAPIPKCPPSPRTNGQEDGTSSSSLGPSLRQTSMPNTIIFHSGSLCTNANEQPHTLASPCYYKPQMPTRRYHPRYAAIGKKPPAKGRLVMAPLRSTRGTKRTSSTSPTLSRNPSVSSGRSTSSVPIEIEHEEIPITIVNSDTARALMGPFRADIVNSNSVCAISGEGKSWVEGLIGTGLEAARIVPQIHWSGCPLRYIPDHATSESEDTAKLEMAWQRTWS